MGDRRRSSLRRYKLDCPSGRRTFASLAEHGGAEIDRGWGLSAKLTPELRYQLAKRPITVPPDQALYRAEGTAVAADAAAHFQYAVWPVG